MSLPRTVVLTPVLYIHSGGLFFRWRLPQASEGRLEHRPPPSLAWLVTSADNSNNVPSRIPEFQNMSSASLPRSAIRFAIATALLMLVPLVAMQFSSEMNWGIEDFLAAGTLLFAAGMTYVIFARRTHNTVQRAVLAVVVVAVLAIIWAELAVGLFH